MNDGLGKKAEGRIQEWLDRPDLGYSFDRIKDQMNGFHGSSNICDFTCFKAPYMYYIESKATYEDRFDFINITETQHKGLMQKSQIPFVYGLVTVLFATHRRCFIFDIQHIDSLEKKGVKSLNIKKIDKWQIPYSEIETIPNNRKILLNYTGDIQVPEMRWNYENSIK